MLGRRPDGTHEIESVIQAVGLFDRLTVTPARWSTIEVSGFDVTQGVDNLVLRAAAAMAVEVTVRLEKAIPPGAGMGGASSDAAALLRALGEGRRDLPRLAAQLGADVPFFLGGGRARATGFGERLEPLPVEPGWFALAWPGFEVSTAAVYRAWDSVGGDGPNHLFRAACAVEPKLAGYAQRLGEGWQMTGSGSAFFHPAASEAEAMAITERVQGWTAVAPALEGL